MLRFHMQATVCGHARRRIRLQRAARGPLFKLASRQGPRALLAADHEPPGERTVYIEVARLTAPVVDLFCRSFPAPAAANTLDIDDT